MRIQWAPISVLKIKLFAILFILSLSPQVSATKLINKNLESLVNESESIVYAVVTKVTDGIDSRGLPYTEVTLDVSDSAKGNLGKGSYTFRQFGLLKPRKLADGRIYLGVRPEGFAKWQAGEQVIAFLYPRASKSGFQTTVGLAQGKFNIAGGNATNEVNNIGLLKGVDLVQRIQKIRSLAPSANSPNASMANSAQTQQLINSLGKQNQQGPMDVNTLKYLIESTVN